MRRELMHVNFINSLRNRNPGAMHVAVPQVDGDASPPEPAILPPPPPPDDHVIAP